MRHPAPKLPESCGSEAAGTTLPNHQGLAYERQAARRVELRTLRLAGSRR